VGVSEQAAGRSSTRAGEDYLLLVESARAEYEARRVTAAEGCWVTMADGRRLLDLHGQYMCVGVGHGHPRLREALHRAIDGLDFGFLVPDLYVQLVREMTTRLGILWIDDEVIAGAGRTAGGGRSSTAASSPTSSPPRRASAAPPCRRARSSSTGRSPTSSRRAAGRP